MEALVSQAIHHTVQQAIRACTMFETDEARDEFRSRLSEILKLARDSKLLDQLTDAKAMEMMDQLTKAAQAGDAKICGQIAGQALANMIMLGIMVGIEMCREEENRVIL